MLQSCRLFQLRIDLRSKLQFLGLKLYCATRISRSFYKILDVAGRRVGAGPEVVAATAAEAARVQQQQLVEITQSFADEWNLKGKIYYKYIGKITNNCTSSTLTNVTLVVHNLQGATSVWGLEKLPGNPKGNIYTLPQSMPSLKPKQSIKFAYVNLARHGQAKFFLLSYKLQQSA